MDKPSIIDRINQHLSKSSKEYYQDYYVGITNNINERLFGFHNVDKDNDWWIYCKADTENICREVEKFYLGKGMAGDTGGGNPENPPIYVYCYEVNDHTKQ